MLYDGCLSEAVIHPRGHLAIRPPGLDVSIDLERLYDMAKRGVVIEMAMGDVDGGQSSMKVRPPSEKRLEIRDEMSVGGRPVTAGIDQNRAARRR
jgi:hypothetical protein